MHRRDDSRGTPCRRPRVNFALPNLQGNTPIHTGNGHTLGERGGEQNHTLAVTELPAHTHVLNASSTPANTNVPTGAYVASVNNAYTAAANLVALSPASVANAGNSQAHLNVQPFLVLNFCIALQGIFPSQN